MPPTPEITGQEAVEESCVPYQNGQCEHCITNGFIMRKDNGTVALQNIGIKDVLECERAGEDHQTPRQVRGVDTGYAKNGRRKGRGGRKSY